MVDNAIVRTMFRLTLQDNVILLSFIASSDYDTSDC